jgi:hypothetical protein
MAADIFEMLVFCARCLNDSSLWKPLVLGAVFLGNSRLNFLLLFLAEPYFTCDLCRETHC